MLGEVPSDAILTQTTLNLQNPDHPYRQKLNADFIVCDGIQYVSEYTAMLVGKQERMSHGF